MTTDAQGFCGKCGAFIVDATDAFCRSCGAPYAPSAPVEPTPVEPTPVEPTPVEPTATAPEEPLVPPNEPAAAQAGSAGWWHNPEHRLWARKLFLFEGTLGRSTYIRGFVLSFLAVWGFGGLVAFVDSFVSGFAMAVVLVTGVAHLSTSAARLRDIGLNPWFVLVGGVPLVGNIALWVVLLGTPTKGRPGKTLLWGGAIMAIVITLFLALGYVISRGSQSAESGSSTSASASASTYAYPTATPKPSTTASQRFQLGRAHYNLGEYRLAIEGFTEAIRLDPQYAQSYRNRGDAYYKLGEYQRAIEDYDEAIRLNPQGAWAYNNRGYAYSQLGEDQRAIKDYDEAIRLDPQDTEAYTNRGYAYQSLGMNEEAERDLAKARELGYEG